MTRDQYLWKSFLEGDKNALSDIFLTYHDDLFRYGKKLTGDDNLVKDAIQDLFLKLWKNRSNLHPIESLGPYLFKSLRNHIIDSIQLIKPCESIDNIFEHPFDFFYSTEDFIINADAQDFNRKYVIDLLNSLKPRQREAIYLRFFENLDFENIAAVMNMNVQSLRNLLHRAIESMRSRLLIPAFLVMLGKSSSFCP